jgi:hypothetical protein
MCVHSTCVNTHNYTKVLLYVLVLVTLLATTMVVHNISAVHGKTQQSFLIFIISIANSTFYNIL